MTVCIATSDFPPRVGGIAIFSAHLAALLTDAGHKVVVLYADHTSIAADDDTEINKGNITLVALKKTYHKHKAEWQPYFKQGSFDAPSWIATGKAMHEWLVNEHQRLGIDVIEASDYGGYGIFLLDAQLPPVVITGHGSLLQLAPYNSPKKDDHYKVVAELEKLTFQFADAIITHSQLNRSDLSQRFSRKIELAKIPWRYSHTDTEKKSTVNEIVVVGGMQPVKGVYTMIEAINLLIKQDKPVKLHWIGGDTWFAPGQQQMSLYLAEKYPEVWKKNFSWENEYTPEQTSMALSKALIVIIPSLFETFNYVSIEAASLAKPIIMTDKTGSVDFFRHEYNAWVIPANDAKELAAAIVHLQDNKMVATELGSNAAAMAQQNFDPQTIISQRIIIYEKAVQCRRQKVPAEADLSFLSVYRTGWRKRFYKVRQIIKNLAGRD